jgi:alkaline phosphatase D
MSTIAAWNCFEGGTDGVAITAGAGGNSGQLSGHYSDVLSGSGGAPIFSNLHPAHGTLGMQCSITTGITASRWTWENTLNSVPTMYGRFYVYLTATSPSATLAILEAQSSNVAVWRICVDTSMKVVSRDVINSANRSTSTMSLSLNTMYRIEFRLACSVTAQVSTIRIYAGDSTTPLEENVSSSWAGQSAVEDLKYGLQQASGPTYTAWFDDIAASDVDWIGPANTQGRNLVWRMVGGVTPTTARVGLNVQGGATSVRIKYSTAQDLATAPAFSASAAPDANGLVTFDLSGLAPNTQYYYGVEVDGEIEWLKNGQFRTFPEPGAKSFSFAFASCASTGSNNVVFDVIRDRNPLFFQHLGDFHYQNITTNDQPLYRAAWARVLQSSRQAGLYANRAFSYIWSDHDSGADNHDSLQPGTVAAAAVYRQAMPGYTLPAADSQGIYYSFVAGRVRFIATDMRSYRSPLANADGPSKTILGTAQKLWFKQQLLAPEPVKVWCLEMPWVGTTTAGEDNYSGYNTERQELAAFITQNRINVMIVAGDMHCLTADDGTNSAGNIPVAHAAPLSQNSDTANGTYSQGEWPGIADVAHNAFGWMDVTDDGDTITMAYTGYDNTQTPRITLTTTFEVKTVESWGKTP